MKKETKIEKVVRELSDLYEFYKKIPKIQEPKKKYEPGNSNDTGQKGH